MIPTYNEKENMQQLITKIFNLKIKDLHIVIVDDNSPDGTAERVKELQKVYKNIHIVIRTQNKGRGYAGAAGFEYCINNGADYIVEMDADLSHNPKYIPALLKELEHADMVLGSRGIQGGKDADRPWYRQIITKGANFYIRILLGVKVKDCNSGFRAFRKCVFEKIPPQTIRAKGPDIVQEILYRAHLKRCTMTEVPIEFIERKEGSSKLGMKQLWKGYTKILELRVLHLRGKI